MTTRQRGLLLILIGVLPWIGLYFYQGGTATQILEAAIYLVGIVAFIACALAIMAGLVLFIDGDTYDR